MREVRYAVVYPFLKRHVDRIFRGREVICKYVGQRTPNFGGGSKVLFYVSGGGLKVVGEGTIATMEFLTPKETISKYGKRLFISKKELDVYRGGRSPEGRLLVLVLTRVTRFSDAIKLTKSITMAGQTLTKDDYVRLRGR